MLNFLEQVSEQSTKTVWFRGYFSGELAFWKNAYFQST